MKYLSPQKVLSTRCLTDQRGEAVITYALVLPLFILLIFGSIEIWRILAVRQSLQIGTYKAARALSSQGRHLVQPPITPRRWQEAAQPIAEDIVAGEVAENTLARSAVPHVSVVPPAVPDCEEIYVRWAELSVDALIFQVEATLSLPWTVQIPFLPPATLTLSVRHLGVLECPEDWDHRQASPPPEGFPY